MPAAYRSMTPLLPPADDDDARLGIFFDSTSRNSSSLSLSQTAKNGQKLTTTTTLTYAECGNSRRAKILRLRQWESPPSASVTLVTHDPYHDERLHLWRQQHQQPRIASSSNGCGVRRRRRRRRWQRASRRHVICTTPRYRSRRSDIGRCGAHTRCDVATISLRQQQISGSPTAWHSENDLCIRSPASDAHAHTRVRAPAWKADYCAVQREQPTHDDDDDDLDDDSDNDDYARPPIERLVTAVRIEP